MTIPRWEEVIFLEFVTPELLASSLAAACLMAAKPGRGSAIRRNPRKSNVYAEAAFVVRRTKILASTCQAATIVYSLGGRQSLLELLFAYAVTPSLVLVIKHYILSFYGLSPHAEEK